MALDRVCAVPFRSLSGILLSQDSVLWTADRGFRERREFPQGEVWLAQTTTFRPPKI